MKKIKIYTSYFYQLRFFKPYMIPFSTAIWDPKWFHNHPSYIFKDKNGIYNGLRILDLAPKSGEGCGSNCKIKDPSKCAFIKKYSEQLEKLNFDNIYEKLLNTAESIKEIEGFEEDPEIILLVYETPDNNCSERKSIQNWFFNNGIIVEEWENHFKKF